MGPASRVAASFALALVLLAAPSRAEVSAASAATLAERVTRFEKALPAVTQGDRTVRLSLVEWMDALAVPGLGIAVIDDYRVVWTKGYGVTARGPEGSAVTPDTLFQAASIAKAVTAVAVMHQLEQGRFALDADINDYVRSWKLPASDVQANEKATVRRLLAHTAGITPGGFAGYDPHVALPTIAQVLEALAPANNPPARIAARPGTEVAYSGLGYTLLQLALEDRLDRSFEAIVQETVLTPAGMRDSTFRQSLPEALAARAAHGHIGPGPALAGGWRAYPELAAAGLWTRPADLASLVVDIARSARGEPGRLLSTETTRLMLSQHQDRMGLGFVVRGGDSHGYFAHSGGNAGYVAHFEMLSETGQGIVVMANADAGQALISLVIAGIANEYDWPLPDRREVVGARAERLFARLDTLAAKPRVAVDLAPAVLARYAGRYRLTPDLVFDITLVEGQLRVRLGDQPQFPLFAESDTKFFLDVVDAQISFVVDGDGQATGLVLHQGGRDRPAPRIE